MNRQPRQKSDHALDGDFALSHLSHRRIRPIIAMMPLSR